MRHGSIAAITLGALAFVSLAALISSGQAQKPHRSVSKALSATIPKTWDDAAMATLEVPLADPIGSPKHVSSDYYYKIPVRPIYKQYSLYAPGREPPGYMNWLKQQEPIIVWGVDPKTGVKHAPPLETKADWIKAGEIVFDSQAFFVPPTPPQRRPESFRSSGGPIGPNGVSAYLAYVIRQKGKPEVGVAGCVECHTRVMPDGSVVKGAQGNKPLEPGIAEFIRGQYGGAKDKEAALALIRLRERAQFEVPWLPLSEQLDYNRMSVDEIVASHATIPAGVLARERSSVLSPPHVPDLVGVKDRHYLDATGLVQQRGIVDLMRYAAVNQGADDLSNYGGFVPGARDLRTLPDPGNLRSGLTLPDRYSDEQLYALALYVYSLKPPPNPTTFDGLAARGQKVFEREGCAMCHTPPLYTNNKLTPAEGFTPPPDAFKKYDILPISVGTDPNLTTKTRRGTGYYKVPSLKGVWYRSMFGHSGWCATLEGWLDPHRVRDDYVPTGFKPYGAKTYAVKGHPFGLDLSAADKKALIAFLKTL